MKKTVGVTIALMMMVGLMMMTMMAKPTEARDEVDMSYYVYRDMCCNGEENVCYGVGDNWIVSKCSNTSRNLMLLDLLLDIFEALCDSEE